MSAPGEAVIVNATVERPMTEVAAEEQSKQAEKPVKEKKPKVPKEKKPRSVKNVSHPPYFEMIKEALLALKEKGGSSPYAIGKYIEEKHKSALPDNFRKILGLRLKNSASKGKLIRVKASYKLSESGKKDNATTMAPKTVAAKKQPDQAKSVAAKSASKGKPAKKSQAVKLANKKSEAVKKAKAKAPATAAARARSKAKAVQKTKKRAAPAKAKAKQPKSIKSPPKKAKKATA